ncbi:MULTISPECIES: ABC transporter permease [Paenibacillus]|uniref:Peptide ABC transporter permease n=2 Tax=Paenibacillus TaxID=44249 RepID=A0A919Y407_9BACL|nr:MULTISPECIES: ABC transporter permease [Paenibacillus]GIO37793.1 peptide ABC transporter permease [Paenibacillus antibioticophila]GIO44237.1 peptide ABC transporter permease [Paenibacillus apis]
MKKRLVLRGNWKGIISSGLLGIIFIVTIFAPWFSPYDPYQQSLQDILISPLSHYTSHSGISLLGTDQLGRDVLSRLLYGGQLSLWMSIVSVLFAGITGSAIGIIAGYFGGKVDAVMMRLADIQLSIPSMLLAIVMVAVLGSGLTNIVIVLSITGWVTFARVVRSQVLSLKEMEFVEAAKAMGVPSIVIMWRHILPNTWFTILTQASLQMSRMILLAASLSFLGLGVDVSTPTWGGMINDGKSYIGSAWWLSTIPGLVIAFVILTINLFSDWLREKSEG